MQDALTRLADLAPTLGEAEFRVLTELSRRALTTGATEAAASSRELAETTKVSRRNIQKAIDELNSRGLIRSDRGTATKAATHKLLFLLTVPIGRGANTAPPTPQQEALIQRQGGANSAPPVASQQRHGGVVAAPLEPPPITRVRAPAIEIPDLSISDEDRSTWRLMNARPSDYDAAELAAARGWMHSHTQKWGTPTSQPPDDKICAELLTVAKGEPIRIENLFFELSAERKRPGEKWAWYVSVAVQRIWKMPPEEYRERRQRLAQMLNHRRQQPGQANERTASAGELKSAIATAAAAKAMR